MAVELERNIRRGEVYWIRSSDTWGYETASSRPGLVVNSQFGIEHSPVVTIVYCTTQCKNVSCNVDLSTMGKPSQALCNQIYTVDKSRFGNKVGYATDDEMNRVDEALAMCLGLRLHKRELDESLEIEKARVAGLEEELMAKRIEIAMVEKMYDKALEMLAGVKLTKDLQTPVQKKTETVKAKIPRIVDDEPEIDEEIERRAEVRPDAPAEVPNKAKVNVNEATWKELHEITGMSETLAHYISGYRKKHGPYGSLNDLLKVDRFSQTHLDKFGNMLTV